MAKLDIIGDGKHAERERERESYEPETPPSPLKKKKQTPIEASLPCSPWRRSLGKARRSPGEEAERGSGEMTKSGMEKKRIRRAASQNGGRDPADSASKKSTPRKDVYQLFADKVRDNKQLESRWAVLQETRVEYFRGKDFVIFLANLPEIKDVLGSDKDLEVEIIVNILLRKNLLVRCDRVVKTVRPGKKKLSSWPAHLEIYQDQVFSENDAFFAWTFMKRRTLWQTILSFLWPLVALAMCLFPVYPYQCKLVVLYSCAGALFFIVTLLSIRAAIFGALWVVLGKRVWFFPNINAEETTFRELVRFWPKKDEGEPPKWTSRLTYAIVAVLVILLLRHHAPDEAARARYQKRVSNIIDDVLEWSPKLALSGMRDTKQTAANQTEESHPSNGSKPSTMEEVSRDEEMKANTDGTIDDLGDDNPDHTAGEGRRV
uniref:Translocation protein SEC62 n=1 Tax=Anthurium amnicola TaxID=1678845 RepID=A0A1D1XUJ7_9ARAE